MDMKFGTYTTSRPITMAELFDGRLGLYGVFEWDPWQFHCITDPVTYERAIKAGFDPCHRCLTTFLCEDSECEDVEDTLRGTRISVKADDETAPVKFSVCLTHDNPREIFDAIAKAFGVEILVERVEMRGYQRATDTCPAWRSNHFGQVDDPPDCGEGVRALYDAEEASNG
jgi:hypothetical protein